VSARVEPTTAAWETVIGLEVHVQLATRTKLFCGCAVQFGAPPNTLTCAVCTAQPGSLPVANREALDLALRAALALGCEVARDSHFDRKNYFYCDLPKGYQITQYDRPFCTGGGLELASGKRVRLVRMHLEEDAGKAVHDRGDMTLVDLNRAGVPLIEAVSEPDLSGAAEAQEYLSALKEILQYVGASGCDMEKGELRCDVNVSVRRPGEALRTRVEIKNLNSFRNVGAAIDHEVARQVAAYESGAGASSIVQETRLFDATAGVTRPMRGKEDAQDYRYFPDPDLPPFQVEAATLASLRTCLPELPAARRARYVRELGLSPYDAGVLTAGRDVADFFEAVARLSGRPKEAANWTTNEVLRGINDPASGVHSIDELPFRPYDVAEVIALVAEGLIDSNGARTLLATLFVRPGRPRELVRELGLALERDSAQLEAWCRAALAGEAAIVADVKAGKTKAVGALIGKVKQSAGRAVDARDVQATLLRLIGELP
jgi:aspartyl-tRNA(Asn)/glutamyl-tRNA(Gln) amidotransferase subunit B